MTMLKISTSNARPSTTHNTAGAVDVDVTITSGDTVILGEVTVFLDRANGGSYTFCGTPIEGVMSDHLVDLGDCMSRDDRSLFVKEIETLAGNTAADSNEHEAEFDISGPCATTRAEFVAVFGERLDYAMEFEEYVMQGDGLPAAARAVKSARKEGREPQPSVGYWIFLSTQLPIPEYDVGDRVESTCDPESEDWDSGRVCALQMGAEGWRYEIGWGSDQKTWVDADEITDERGEDEPRAADMIEAGEAASAAADTAALIAASALADRLIALDVAEGTTPEGEPSTEMGQLVYRRWSADSLTAPDGLYGADLREQIDGVNVRDFGNAYFVARTERKES